MDELFPGILLLHEDECIVQVTWLMCGGVKVQVQHPPYISDTQIARVEEHCRRAVHMIIPHEPNPRSLRVVQSSAQI